MDAKEILKKIKAVFDGTQVLPPVAPIVPAPQPVKLATNYPVDGGQPVYVDSTIDVGVPAFSDEALTTPYPDGTFTVTGTQFSFTVAAGAVTAVNGTLDAAAPVAPAPVVPAGPTIPQFEAMEKEVNELKEALKKANLLAEKHEKILPDLFELTEKLIGEPVSDPATLTGAQKDKFDYAKQKEDRIAEYAKTLKKIKTK